MKKYNITSILGIIGMVTWTITIFLRELSLTNINISFILGIMPNISATWLFIWMGEIIVNRKNIHFNFKVASITSWLNFLFAIISEIIHDIFLNSSFDIYDIIATLVSIIIYLVFFYFTENTLKISEQH